MSTRTANTVRRFAVHSQDGATTLTGTREEIMLTDMRGHEDQGMRITLANTATGERVCMTINSTSLALGGEGDAIDTMARELLA